MTEERIKELATPFAEEMAKLLRAVAAEAREEGLPPKVQELWKARAEGRVEGIDEMRDAVRQKIWDILHAHKILARLLVLRTGEEAERLKEKGCHITE